MSHSISLDIADRPANEFLLAKSYVPRKIHRDLENRNLPVQSSGLMMLSPAVHALFSCRTLSKVRSFSCATLLLSGLVVNGLSPSSADAAGQELVLFSNYHSAECPYDSVELVYVRADGAFQKVLAYSAEGSRNYYHEEVLASRMFPCGPKTGYAAGQSWTSTFREDGIPVTATCTIESLTASANGYTDCMKVVSSFASTLTYWPGQHVLYLKEGVGPVYVTRTYTDSESSPDFTMRLTSFSIGAGGSGLLPMATGTRYVFERVDRTGTGQLAVEFHDDTTVATIFAGAVLGSPYGSSNNIKAAPAGIAGVNSWGMSFRSVSCSQDANLIALVVAPGENYKLEVINNDATSYYLNQETFEAADCVQVPVGGTVVLPVFGTLADTDSDGIKDYWERAYGLNPGNAADAVSDYDADGANALQEHAAQTDPFSTFVRIRPGQLWVDTGLDVSVGQSITTEIYGATMSPFVNSGVPALSQWCDADGVAESLLSDQSYYSQYPALESPIRPTVSGCQVGALIGRVGQGNGFRIGKTSAFTSPGSGRLYLGVNQFDGLYIRQKGFGRINVRLGGAAVSQYPLTVVASPSEGGTVSGSGSYAAGASVRINANPNPGWRFVNWSDGDSNAERTVVVLVGGLSLTANFTASGPALSVTTESPLPQGTVGSAYNQTLTGTGGTPPYTWSVSSGKLPAGLSLSQGIISGTPAAAGTFSFKVKVADSAGKTATKAFTLTIDPVAVEDSETLTVGVRYDLGPFGGADTGGGAFFSKLSSGKLPAGMKAEARADGVYVTGVPTKAGDYQAVLLIGSGVNGSAGVRIALTLHLVVENLPAWAWGSFNGRVSVWREDVREPGAVSMTVTAVGKAAGKYSFGGTNYTFVAASYSRRDVDGTFTMEAQIKSGKVALPLEIKVYKPVILDSEVTVPQSLGVAEGWLDGDREHEPPLLMWRDVWKDADMVSVPLDFAGYYTATLPGNEAYGSGYLALTADKAGKVKTAGKLADGTPVSLAGTLVVDDVGRVFAVLYTSPAAYKGGSFYGLAEFVEPGGGGYKFLRLRDGGPAFWQSRSPQATETYGGGFTREPVLTGGWYSRTENLYDYYEGNDLTVRTDQEAAAPALAVGTDRYSSICWDPSGVVLSPVLKSGVMTGLTAPPAGIPTDPDKDGVWDYGAANSVGLKVSLARPTGIFKGSFKAWFDYPVKKHVSKSLSFEGVLTPEREDKTDGTEGRGFFLWPDKAALPGVAKTYAFNWSYDFTLANQIGSPSSGDFTGIWLATPTQGDNTKVSFWQEGDDIWMGVEKGTVSGQNFSIDIPYREPTDDDEWVMVGVTGKMEDGVIKGTVKNQNAFSGAFSTTSYTATKLSTGSMSAAGNFNNRSGFDRSGEAVGYLDDEGDLKLFMSGGKEFVAEFEVEYPPKGQLTTGQLMVSQGYEFELTCAMPGYPDLDLDEPATSGWVNLTRCDTRVVGTYDVYFRNGDWHVSGSFDVPCTLVLDQ